MRIRWYIPLWLSTVRALKMTRTPMSRWIFCTLPSCEFFADQRVYAHVAPTPQYTKKKSTNIVGSGFSPALR
jgi:hypothetical protein